jgi:hypothetical protein
MKFLRFTTFFLTALTIIFLAIGIFLPRDYTVNKQVTVKAEIDSAFAQANNLKLRQEWSPWKQLDPSMIVEYSSRLEGEGAWYSWSGKQMGEGTFTVVASHPNKRIDIRYDFSTVGTAEGWHTFKTQGDSIIITESFYMDVGWNIPGRYLGLMVETVLGLHLETGLYKLKRLLEKDLPLKENSSAIKLDSLKLTIDSLEKIILQKNSIINNLSTK